ncbi:hypothetical protein IID24_03170 [Patescibacteria group bacterium]|nr:hypothetical protein [Patescibacteria group bacterium]
MVFYVAAASIVVFLFFLFPVTDFDIWWHLAGGQFMIENWQFPYIDTFSYTANGISWLPNSWGFTALTYLGFQLFGLDGLNILKALVSLSIFLVIVFYLFREKLLNLFSLSFVVLALFFIHDGFSLRPHTLSYLFFVLFVTLLFTYKKHRTYQLIAALAAVQLVWTNLHASFIWGLIFTTLFVAADHGFRTFRVDRKSIILGMSIGIASLAHIFYGPIFLWRIVTEFLSPAAQVPIRDLLPASTASFFSFPGIVLVFAWLLIIFMSIKKKQFDILLSTLIITVIAFLSSRFVRDLVLFLAILTPMYLPYLRDRIPKQIFITPKWIFRASFFAFLFVLFFIAKSSSPGIGLGLSKFSYPVEAVEFIQREQLLEKSTGNLYHTYNFGGYLIWANQPHKVFIDGRVRPYLGKIFNRYWNNFEGGEVWQDTQTRYNITTALMTLPHISGGRVYNTSSPMFAKNEWALIYYDDVAAIYVRRVEELQDVIETYEYTFLDPQNLDTTYLQPLIQSQEDFDAVLEELQRALSLNPDSYRLHFTAAYVFSLVGQDQLMIEELNKTLEINPHFKTAQDILDTI